MKNAKEIQKLIQQVAKLQKENEQLKELADVQSHAADQLNLVVEMSKTGTWEWNVQTGETTFNEQWANILGYTLSELQPISIETWKNLTHPDDFKEAQKLLDKYFNHEIPFYQSEFRMKHRDGHWKWILDRGRVAEWTPDGKPLLMLGTHQSINKRKETEQKLEKTNRLYAVISQVNQAIVHFKSKEKLLKEICSIAIDFGLFKIAWVGLLHENEIENYMLSGDEKAFTAIVGENSKNRPSICKVALENLKSGNNYVCNSIERAPCNTTNKHNARKCGYRSSIFLPFNVFGKTIGFLAIYAEQEGFFNDEEVKLLDEVMFDVGFALEALENSKQREEAVKALGESEKKVS